ncbi:M20/M25/M40 family metallo-hydrolase [Acidipila sp. EB88]|nr:M20/M25/M40 family metallo-hydrolase [Acidipila sp. EB88]
MGVAQKSVVKPGDGTRQASAAMPEAVDLGMYARIRDEGLNHSRVMEYASALNDDIGPRLTGSPGMARANAWTRDTLTAMGCANAHLEDWGEFGMGWEQEASSLRMVLPAPGMFIAQAAPWSPSTVGADGKPGPVQGEAVRIHIDTGKNAPSLETQMAEYKGKLRGKVVLLGNTPELGEVDKALVDRYSDEELAKLEVVPLGPVSEYAGLDDYFIKVMVERERLGQMLKDEGVAAVVVPSSNGSKHGGSGGTIFDDSNSNFSWFSYQRAHATPLPLLVASIENFGRVARLLDAKVPVTLAADVDAKFTGDHEHGFDTIAEIPGTDPLLKDQVVMVGGHLDSWASATGATDNGAGSVVAMEVMRILLALHVQPRRTIRIGLWSGEEQGIFGSAGYVAQHFGTLTLGGNAKLPDFVREPSGPPVLKPEQAKLSGYFNLDNGSGKIRGVYTQGNAAMAPIFTEWIAPLKDLGVSTVTNANTGGTDHLSFDAVGIPGFQFIQDALDYDTRTHHSNMDVYEGLRADDLRQAAVVEATFVYNTAMRDAMLPRKATPEYGERKVVQFPGAVK